MEGFRTTLLKNNRENDFTFFRYPSEKGFFIFMKGSTKILARSGIIASLYVILSLIVFPASSGAVQFRVSEVLTLLPLIYIEAVPALFIGCILSNFITGCAFFDVVLGSLVTLICAILTFLIGKLIKNKPLKVIIGGLFPLTFNAFLLPLIWLLCYGALEYVYIFQVLVIFIGQSLSVYALGVPIYLAVDKIKARGVKFLE